MKKNKILIAAISGIAVIIIGIVVAMFATGKFSSLINSFESEPTTTVPAETTQAIIQVSGRPKSVKPESIIATEYSDYSESSAEDLAKFENLGFNTVIFELNSNNTETVASLLEIAGKNSLYYGIYADISQGSDYLTDFSKKLNTDFIILGGYDETLTDYTEKISTICKTIKEDIDPAMSIGLKPSYTSKATQALTDIVTNGNADFVYLCHESKKNSVFESAQAVWNEETCPLWLCHNLSGLSSFSTDDASAMVDLIAASADMSMCKALAFTPFTDISKASGTSADIVMNYVRERDTYLLDKNFSLTSHKNTNITVEQSTITFRGTSSPAHELKCNGKVLNVAKNGDFSVDVGLEVGKNTIKFEHKNKTYTYTVTYKIKLLKSVSPADDISVPGEMLVEVSAIAHKKASVSVVFNGKTYKMTATGGASDSEEETPDESSDFTTFTATLETPASTDKVQKLGKYKVTAKYSSLTETLSGANINITAQEIVVPPPVTQPVTTTTTTQLPTTTTTSADESGENSTDVTHSSGESTSATVSESESGNVGGTLQKYYYSENYGLGTARICEIIDDYVETYPGNTTSTFSVPDCSPLLKGTVDYVKSTATYDGDTYYILASGVKVPHLREERLASGIEGKITHVNIKDGYIMPKNNINVLSSSTNSGDTVIVLEMNRSVAFNASLLGQTYTLYNGNKLRPVVVSSLNCTGFEITFSDTVSAQGNVSLMNSVCKSAKWSSDSSKSTVTLSFELAQKGKFYGFHYEYDKNGNLVITIKHKPASSLSGYTIMLDPGHGGIDPGAGCAVSSASLGQEKDINLSIATKVRELLEAEGAKVIMTRSTDKWVCYADRNAAVRNQNPDMFIAIHCDSSSSASAMGTSAYYYRAYSQPLAKEIHENIVNAYKNQIYKDRDESIKSKISRGANFYAFRVARVEECPAILIEYGFVSNTDECQILQTAANRDVLAAATVQGIKDYISQS
ncbi:MAG: N-acetylmuramoyl-L-alanine amidase [Ruminococcaceae bacterium]|nr:N-acetylmuramoyl-L-alanine amidase [Oscillospiraceae bacterium]